MNRLKVGLVFGGRSGEHEVSIRSAKSIYDALDKNKYQVFLAGIDKTGGWHVVEPKWLPGGAEMKSLLSGENHLRIEEQKADVIFPIVHGTYGEDGCLQGLLEILDVAYVGAGVLGSAVGMDKDIQKRLLMQAGVKTAEYLVINSADDLNKIKVKKYPVFVKPASMGSSVGVSKVSSLQTLNASIKKALKYDRKALVEEFIEGREIEVAVLDGKASIPGEVIPKGHEFYDYEAKYIDENGAELRIPAKLKKALVSKIQQIAEKVFNILECEGMARVDMFLKKSGEVIVNEINTLPGFTNISMYPRLWEASGLSYSKLLDRLIEIAIKRQREKMKLVRSYNQDGDARI